MIEKILVCTDGSDHALQATILAAELCQKFGCEIILFNVFFCPYAQAPDTGMWEIALGEAAIDKLCKEDLEHIKQDALPVLEQAGVPYRIVQEIGHPVEEIIQASIREKADMIILGSRGLSRWKALMMGSVTDGVIHQASCPALIVRGYPTLFRSILLAADGSDSSVHAAQLATGFASKLDSSLTILNVTETHKRPPGVTERGQLLEELSQQIMKRIEETIIPIALKEDVHVSMRQINGHPARTIAEFADDNDNDLIVMGRRGRSPIKSLLLGSVSDRVSHLAHCSVMISR